MFRRYSLSFVFAFIFIVLAMPSGHAVSIGFGSVEGRIANTVMVPVSITSDGGVGGINLRITYDPAILTLPSVQAGPLMTASHVAESHSPTPGQLNVLAYAPNTPAAFSANSGQVLYLVFEVDAGVTPGVVTQLNLTGSIGGTPSIPSSGLSALGGSAIGHTASGGSVTAVIDAIMITFPTGGEKFPRGDSRTITWTTTGNTGPSVNIFVLGGASTKLEIFAAPNTGSNQLFLPTSLEPRADYQLLILSTLNGSIFDISAPFEIVPNNTSVHFPWQLME